MKNIKNIFSYTYKIDKSAYFLPALKILLNAIKNALSLVLSAQILEMIYQNSPMEEIIRPVILLLAMNFLLTMAASVLQEEWIGPIRANVRRTFDGNLAAKFQRMDYSLVDSPYVKKLYERIQTDNTWGNGMTNIFWDFDAIMGAICNLVCSFTVAFPILKIIFTSHSLQMYLGLVILLCPLASDIGGS